MSYIYMPPRKNPEYPTLYGRKEQLTLEEEADTRRIASVRSHVKKVIKIFTLSRCKAHKVGVTIKSKRGSSLSTLCSVTILLSYPHE